MCPLHPQTVVRPLDSGCHHGSLIGAVTSILGGGDESAQLLVQEREGRGQDGAAGLRVCVSDEGT